MSKKKTKAERLATRREWYARNADAHRKKGREYMRNRRATLPEKCRAESRASAAKRSVTIAGRATILFNAARRRAKLKGLPFDLTREWVLKQLESGCALTGFTFVLERGRGPGNRHAFAPSIDRKIPSDGYTKANCRAIVWCLNAALSTWGESDLCAALAAWRASGV